MNTIYLYALTSVSLVGVLSLAGIFVSRNALVKITSTLVSLACGAMLANALVDLIPESFEQAEKFHLGPMTVPLCILGGFLACFVLDRVLKLRCHHSGVRHESEEHCHLVKQDQEHPSHAGHIHPTGHMSIVAHGLDNFTDGILIGLTYMASIPAGLVCTLAIVLHEIPMEFGGFGVLVNAGFSRGTAILINFLSAVVAFTGTLLVLWLGSVVTWLPPILTPVGAGIVLYITASGLIPQLHEEQSRGKAFRQFLVMMLGVTVMVAVKFFFD